MSNDFTRRELLKSSGLIVGASVLAPQLVFADVSKPTPSSKTEPLIRLSLNENPYGPSPNVARALQLEFGRLSRYADLPLAGQLAEQIAEYEHIPVEQVKNCTLTTNRRDLSLSRVIAVEDFTASILYQSLWRPEKLHIGPSEPLEYLILLKVSWRPEQSDTNALNS
jgi:hypothetical protein